MKFISTLCLAVSCCLIGLDTLAQTYLISEGGTVNTCSGILFDSGGISDNYFNNEADTMTFCSDTPGSDIFLNILFFDIETNWDYLYVYAGSEAIGTPLITFSGTYDPQTIATGSECVTLLFTSDGSITDPGFAMQITCDPPNCMDGIQNGNELGIDCGGPDCTPCAYVLISEELNLVSCDAQILDSGASQDYGDNEDYTMSFCSDGSGSCLQINLNYLNIGQGDHLYIYDGPDANSFLLADFSNIQGATSLQSTSGCVTFNFVSNDEGTSGGFDMQLTCTDICPTCDDGILNGQEIDVDCGGPDCPDCDFIVMGGTQTAASCSTLVYDQGYTGNYSNDAVDVLTICSDTPGECVNVEFLLFELEENYDFLTVYAGASTSDPIYGEYTGNDSPGVVDPGTECITIEFISDYSVTREGYVFEVTCGCPSCDDGVMNGQEIGIDCGGPLCPACDFNAISEGGTITSCDATLFDSGIFDNYQGQEDYTMSICSPEVIDSMLVAFQTVAIGIGDHLYIHEGTDTGGEMLADVTAAVNWDDVLVPDACVTFRFVSNEIGESQGFEVGVTCVESNIVSGLNELDQFGIQVLQDLNSSEMRIDFNTVYALSMALYDASGREVMTQNINSGDYQDLSSLESGVYLLSLSQESQFIYSQKIIILK